MAYSFIVSVLCGLLFGLKLIAECLIMVDSGITLPCLFVVMTLELTLVQCAIRDFEHVYVVFISVHLVLAKLFEQRFSIPVSRPFFRK
jgi:hypothetical protein